MEDFAKHQVKQYVKTKVTAITADGVTAENAETGDVVEIPCDYVVMAVGSKKNSFSAEGITVPVKFVGDCSGEKTADIAAAIRSAYHAANEI